MLAREHPGDNSKLLILVLETLLYLLADGNIQVALVVIAPHIRLLLLLGGMGRLETEWNTQNADVIARIGSLDILGNTVNHTAHVGIHHTVPRAHGRRHILATLHLIDTALVEVSNHLLALLGKVIHIQSLVDKTEVTLLDAIVGTALRGVRRIDVGLVNGRSGRAHFELFFLIGVPRKGGRGGVNFSASTPPL